MHFCIEVSKCFNFCSMIFCCIMNFLLIKSVPMGAKCCKWWKLAEHYYEISRCDEAFCRAADARIQTSNLLFRTLTFKKVKTHQPICSNHIITHGQLETSFQNIGSIQSQTVKAGTVSNGSALNGFRAGWSQSQTERTGAISFASYVSNGSVQNQTKPKLITSLSQTF